MEGVGYVIDTENNDLIQYRPEMSREISDYTSDIAGLCCEV